MLGAPTVLAAVTPSPPRLSALLATSAQQHAVKPVYGISIST